MPVTADDIFNGDWDGIAPQQRGCFRALVVQPSTRGLQWTGNSSISVGPKRPNPTVTGGGGRFKAKGGDPDENNFEIHSKLLSNPPRSKSVPPALSWRGGNRFKTVVVQEEPRNKNTKTTVSIASDDTDALLGRRGKLKTAKNSRDDDYDDRIDSTYIPPQKDRFIWHQNSSSPDIHRPIQSSQTRDSDQSSKGRSIFDTNKDQRSSEGRISDSSSRGLITSTSKSPSQTRDFVKGFKERSYLDAKQDKGNKDARSESSSTDRATSKSNPIISNAISRWKAESKDIQESNTRKPLMRPVVGSKGAPTIMHTSSMNSYEIKHRTVDSQNRPSNDVQNDVNLADLLSTNLKQMEKDIEDLNKRKYSKEVTRHVSKEQEYLSIKQRIQEQEEALLREQKLIPAEISLQAGVRDAYLYKDDGDSVSELGTESVTPKLNTSGLTLVYTDRAQRANYVNDIDDTVDITEDAPYSAYHRGTGNHFKNSGTRRDATRKPDYEMNRRRQSKSLTRFDNRGLPDVSLIDSESEYSARDIIEDDYPLHSKGLSLTEAFNDFGLDDRISTVRKSQRFEEDILDNYEHRSENMKVGRRVLNGYQAPSTPPSDSTDTPRSNNSTALTRFLASRALRSNKYVEAGGAVRLKRDHVSSSISNRHDEEEKRALAARSGSNKRGTLSKGSFPVMAKANFETPNEHFDLTSTSSMSYGTQRSRRMMRSL